MCVWMTRGCRTSSDSYRLHEDTACMTMQPFAHMFVLNDDSYRLHVRFDRLHDDSYRLHVRFDP